MKLFETKLPDAFSRALFDEMNLDLAQDHLDKIYDCIFVGTAQLLAHSKSMDHPTAFVFDKLDGSFVAACIVQFFDNEDKKNPGNWNMVWTFNEEDIPKNAFQIKLSNPQSHTYFIGVAGEKYGMRFEDSGCLANTLVYAMSQLKKWLDENAKEGETIMVEQDGLFQGRVAIEGGEKVFAIEPDGEIKNIIKDDAAIEK